jgi:hypothetical protein
MIRNNSLSWLFQSGSKTPGVVPTQQNKASPWLLSLKSTRQHQRFREPVILDLLPIFDKYNLNARIIKNPRELNHEVSIIPKIYTGRSAGTPAFANDCERVRD